MNPSATGIAGVSAAVTSAPPRRRVATTAAVVVTVMATLTLAEVVTTSLTARSTTVEAQVTRAGQSVCLHTAGVASLCLNGFHTSHLRLATLSAGQCVRLTYQGQRLAPTTVTAAWTTRCTGAAA